MLSTLQAASLFAFRSSPAVTQVRRSPPMSEPARRVSYVMAALATAICVSATPTIAQDEYAAPSLSSATYSPSTDLRVPSDEPKYAAIVMDAATGEILYQKRAESP